MSCWYGRQIVSLGVRHFLELLDMLNHLGVEFVSFRENLDTCGLLGRAVIVIVSAVAQLERNLIIERVRAGLRRARLEGRVWARKRLRLLDQHCSSTGAAD